MDTTGTMVTARRFGMRTTDEDAVVVADVADLIAAGPQVVRMRMTPDGVVIERNDMVLGALGESAPWQPVRVGYGPGPQDGDIQITFREDTYVGMVIAFGDLIPIPVPYILSGQWIVERAALVHATDDLRTGFRSVHTGPGCPVCGEPAVGPDDHGEMV